MVLIGEIYKCIQLVFNGIQDQHFQNHYVQIVKSLLLELKFCFKMRELIKKISIRARVAFIILCIENAFQHLKFNVELQKTLNVFWLQTNNTFVDDWLYQVSKVMPDSILEDDYEDNELLTHIEYIKLRESYKFVPKFIFELMECAFECGHSGIIW